MIKDKYTAMSVYAVKYERFDLFRNKIEIDDDIAYFASTEEALDFVLEKLIENGYDDYSVNGNTIDVINEQETYQHFYKLEELRVGKYSPDSIRKSIHWN